MYKVGEIMDVRNIQEIKKIMEEWIKEVEQLEPLEIEGSILNNSLNKPRIELERKYRKRIEEVLMQINSYKSAVDMTEEEAKAYCEEYAKQGQWEAHSVQLELQAGRTYRQIAFALQNS